MYTFFMEDAEISHLDEKKQEANEIVLGRNRLVGVEELFTGMDWITRRDYQDLIYDNYAKAMRLRNRKPLEPERFIQHFFDGGNFSDSVAFGSPKDGYLLGSEINEVFVPTHFAPSGLRQGYRLIKDLVDSPMPTALFITPDLVDTVKKMKGWKVLPFHFTTNFRGSDVEKTLVISKWSAVSKLLSHQTKQIVDTKYSQAVYKTKKTRSQISEFGQKALKLIKKDKTNAHDVHDELKGVALFTDEQFDDLLMQFH